MRVSNGKITRDEGVNLVKKYDLEFPKKYFKEFLEYIDISEEQFHKTIDNFRSQHLWSEESGEWQLRHPVWHD